MPPTAAHAVGEHARRRRGVVGDLAPARVACRRRRDASAAPQLLDGARPTPAPRASRSPARIRDPARRRPTRPRSRRPAPAAGPRPDAGPRRSRSAWRASRCIGGEHRVVRGPRERRPSPPTWAAAAAASSPSQPGSVGGPARELSAEHGQVERRAGRRRCDDLARAPRRSRWLVERDRFGDRRSLRHPAPAARQQRPVQRRARSRRRSPTVVAEPARARRPTPAPPVRWLCEERLDRRLQRRRRRRRGARAGAPPRRPRPAGSRSPSARAYTSAAGISMLMPRSLAARRPSPAVVHRHRRGSRPADPSAVHTVHRLCPQAVDRPLYAPTRAACGRDEDAERGSTLPFVLVCWLVAALMAFGAIAASDAFLEQQEVQSVCDGAALAAANQADEAVVYARGVGTELPLTRAAAAGGGRRPARRRRHAAGRLVGRDRRRRGDRPLHALRRHRLRLAVPRRAAAGAHRDRQRPRPDARLSGTATAPDQGGRGPSYRAWRVKDSNLRRLSRRIYSPLPLATRATRRAVVPEQLTRTADGVPGVPGSASAAARRRSAMADASFDVVSKVDRQEVDNALNQAGKELSQRFDFRGTNADHLVGRRGRRHAAGRHRGAGRAPRSRCSRRS